MNIPRRRRTTAWSRPAASTGPISALRSPAITPIHTTAPLPHQTVSPEELLTEADIAAEDAGTGLKGRLGAATQEARDRAAGAAGMGRRGRAQGTLLITALALPPWVHLPVLPPSVPVLCSQPARTSWQAFRPYQRGLGCWLSAALQSQNVVPLIKITPPCIGGPAHRCGRRGRQQRRGARPRRSGGGCWRRNRRCSRRGLVYCGRRPRHRCRGRTAGAGRHGRGVRRCLVRLRRR